MGAAAGGIGCSGGGISFGVDLSGGKDRAWEKRLVMVVRCSRGEVDIHPEAAGDGDCTVPVPFVRGGLGDPRGRRGFVRAAASG